MTGVWTGLCEQIDTYLRDVDEGALRASCDHSDDIVGRQQRVLCGCSRIITCLVQHLIHIAFERLQHCHTRLSFELSGLQPLRQALDFLLGLQQCNNKTQDPLEGGRCQQCKGSGLWDAGEEP